MFSSSSTSKLICAFFKIQTRYHWPHEAKNKDGSCKVQEEEDIFEDEVTYMSDELGLHRVENTSHSDGAVSLHLYSPPFNSCQVCDLSQTEQDASILRVFMYKFNNSICIIQ